MNYIVSYRLTCAQSSYSSFNYKGTFNLLSELTPLFENAIIGSKIS